MAKKKKTEITEDKTEKVFANEGEKIEVESCPKCNSELVIKMKEGTEVFECENCKFVKTNKKTEKKVEKSEEKKQESKKAENKDDKKENKSEEFPDVEIGFDPFAQQN